MGNGNSYVTDVEKKINPKTKAIAVTHMWGLPCQMDVLVNLAKSYNLKLVEDCAHAHLTTFQGKLLGTFGDVACFSIGAKKTWTSGEGGFLITNDPEIYIRATLLGHFVMRAEDALARLEKDGFSNLVKKYARFISGYGENYRMHPYSAVMALAAFKILRKTINNRAESLRYFTEKLEEVPGIYPPVVNEDYFNGAMYGFKAKLVPEKTEKKNFSIKKIINAIKAEGVKIKLPDTTPLHNDPLFTNKENGYFRCNAVPPAKIEGDFSGANEYMRGRVSLPTFSGGLSKDKEVIDQYCAAIRKVLKNLDQLP